MTAEQLGVWMRSSHPSMPAYMFSDANVDEVAAYIMGLRHTR